MRGPHLLLVGAMLAALAVNPCHAAAKCASLLSGAGAGGRDITAMDLATLRDFGDVGSPASESPFSISPNGAALAVQLRMGDPRTNSFCLGLVLVDRSGAQPPRLLDSGGQLPLLVINSNGKGLFDTGYVMPTTPRWSPNGRTLAFLKRLRGSTQIYTVRVDGGASRQITTSASDIEDFAWSADGRSVIYKTAAHAPAAVSEIDRTGREGWLYDERFYPIQQSRPYPAEISDAFLVVAGGGGSVRSATAKERKLLDPSATFKGKSNLEVRGVRSSAGTATIEPEDQGVFWSSSILRLVSPSGQRTDCPASTCRGRLQGLWRRPDDRGFLFMRRQGHAESHVALYSWIPGTGDPKRLLDTTDLLFGCQEARGGLACAHESSTKPREIASVDADTGDLKTIFDPNPEFRRLRQGSVQRLEWSTADREAFGDLVLPPNHKPGEKHPLVIVGYETRGFLRGGTGDEQPIYALAARGFAVLTYQAGLIQRSQSTSALDYMRSDNVKWAARQSMTAVITTGVAAAARLGSVDVEKIGITGFSEGAGTALYAMIDTPSLYAAASLSPCCSSPEFVALNGPGSGNSRLLAKGWPGLSTPNPDYWAPMSLAQNAERVRTPILVQVADREFLGGIIPYQARREAGRPFEMYVFPNEYHYKHQPAHRLAIYERNLAWFDFWLHDGKAEDPKRASEVGRWRAMAAAADRSAEAVGSQARKN